MQIFVQPLFDDGFQLREQMRPAGFARFAQLVLQDAGGEFVYYLLPARFPQPFRR